MFSKQYDFSGICLCVESDEELTIRESLNTFEAQGKKPDCTVHCRFVESLPETASDVWEEGEARCFYRSSKISADKPEQPYVHLKCSGNRWELQMLDVYRGMLDVSQVLHTIDLHHVLLTNAAVILHASYIVVNGEAILFSAPSGTGKSTQAELWKTHRGAKIINGDRCLIRRTKDGFTAGGIYYSGTSEYCENTAAPIRAVVLIRQAETNKVTKPGGGEALRRLHRECAYNNTFEEDKQLAVNLLADLINTVPVLELACLPDEGAVEVLEEFLRGESNGSTVC